MADTKSSGISFGGLLTIVFITLKLTKQINWSWFWVLSPIIIPSIIGICFLLFAFIANVKKIRKGKKQLQDLIDKNKFGK